jgi:hypothetical protein
MRNIHDQKKNGSLGVNTAGIDTSNKFTWNNSVEKIEKYV